VIPFIEVMVDHNITHHIHVSLDTEDLSISNELYSIVDNPLHKKYEKIRHTFQENSESTSNIHEIVVLTEKAADAFRDGNLNDLEQILGKLESLILKISSQQLSKIEKTIGDYYYLQGIYYFIKNNLKLSFQFMLRSMTIREKIADLIHLKQNYSSLAILSIEMGNEDDALLYFTKSIELSNYFEKFKDDELGDLSSTTKIRQKNDLAPDEVEQSNLLRNILKDYFKTEN
jgi:hypothetical protein